MEKPPRLNDEQFLAAIDKLSENGVKELVARLVDTALGLNKEEKEAVEFAFWMSARVEKFVGKGIQAILGTDEHIGRHVASKYRALRQEIVEQVTDDLFLLGKVKLLKKIVTAVSGNNPRNLETFLKEVNELRNNISHGRFKNLTYMGKPLTKLEVRKRLLKDYKESFQSVSKWQ